ncbi:hypothetical protein DNU06_12720 [Putridiphycobacter roseus]|uniref:PKD domain-containing protein n=1 Tax=Putridiphycobacter roseus TaxID=2219161 RepID=A0A2W1NP66_9FLAO|nr:PKD domain-containing protein [Putridiphycobacter roseus]PZE16408.1 hypothetical protein DNU06_12720 [Putridiphycobacter roseus]
MKYLFLLFCSIFFVLDSYGQLIMGTTFNSTTCQETVFDSGGTGAGGPYGLNENQTLTICPNTPGDYISLVWTIFSLDGTNTSTVPNTTNADNITIYNAATADPAFTLGTYYAGDLSAGDVFGANLALNPAGNGCLTIVFNSNNQGVGDFSCTVSCATPCDPPNAIGMIVNADNAAGDSIAICVGETVTFQDNGSTAGPSGLFTLEKWIWQWQDGTDNDTISTGGPITHYFSNPGEYIVQLVVLDDNGCVNSNATDIRVYVSTYPTFIPFPFDTTLCIGESITLNANPTYYDSTWSGFPLSVQNSDNCMEDVTGVVQPTPLAITGFSNIILDNANPDVFSVCVDIEHSFIGDFVLQVQCPTGQIMTLHQQGGGGIDLGSPVTSSAIDCVDPTTFGVPWNYCFDATSTETWVQAVANGNTVANPNGGTSIPSGNYLPVDPLGFAALDGCPINGTWNLLFTDLWGGDDGSIPGWSINFDPALYPPATIFTPTTGGNSDSSYWDLSSPYIASNSADLNTITVTPTIAGSYDYTYFATNNFGCTFDSTITITVDGLTYISAGLDTTMCGGSPIAIGPTDDPCDYRLLLFDSFGDSWNGNTIDITTVAGGTVNYPGPPADSIWITLPMTHGETITLDFNNTGNFIGECEIYLYAPDGSLIYSDGVIGFPNTNPQSVVADCYGGFNFSWTPTANIIGNPNVVNPVVDPPVQTTYTLTSYPVGHPDCITTDDVEVFLGPVLDPGQDTMVSFCLDGMPEDLFTHLAGTPMNTGNWFDPSGNPIAMPVDPGTMVAGLYEYRIDSLTCSLSAFVNVTIIALPINVVLTDVDCYTLNTGSIVLSSPSANSYSNDGGLTFQSMMNFNGLFAGSYDLVLASGLNGAGCTADTTVIIGEPDPLSFTYISPPEVICPDEPIALSVAGTGGNGTYTFNWSNGLGTGIAVNYVPQNTDTLFVNMSEACGSPSIDTFVVISTPAPIVFDYYFDNTTGKDKVEGCSELEFIINNVSYSNGTAQSPVSSLVSTKWDFLGNATKTTNGAANLEHSIEQPGIYSVSVEMTSDYGCNYYGDINNNIEVFELPVAKFMASPNSLSIFSTVATFTDLSQGDPTAWLWTFTGGPIPSSSGDQNPVIKYPEGVPGIFPIELQVWNENACTDATTGTISVLNDVNVYAPNIFTPDGDQFNNTWRVYIDGIDVYDFHLTIYNRWGELVFESFDKDGEWDGTYGNNGKLVPDGNYVWIIDAKDIVNDNRYDFKGTILMMK